MFKNLLLTSFLLFTVISIIYPAKREDTKLFDYCYSLEKSLSRNSLMRRNGSKGVKSITSDILDFGLSKTKGALINKMIDKYKNSKNSEIIKLVPNGVYCFGGYWIEIVNPGTFESVLYSKSKKAINEFKNLKDEVDAILDNINTEYNGIKKEFNRLF